ncbi:MAG TPA: outer-membrane lipoprotein carrier protein LolA [Microvirga sp.]|jgi:outer membrane lipoprotein-sorting protein|nr:outer-membrane lipoprotein carrier protein LolA [Microvirga sp.]
MRRGLPAGRVTAGLNTLMLGAALCALAASPASAQSFLETVEKLFRFGSSPEAPAAPAPAAPDAAPAGSAAPGGWPARIAVIPPKRPAEAAALPAAPAAQVAAAVPSTVVPSAVPIASAPRAQAPAPAPAVAPPPAAAPAAPALRAPAATAPSAPPKPVVTAAAPSVPMVPQEPLSQQAAIERANAYFSNLGTLVADFTQIGADGRRQGGTLYLQRPGKLRFDYEAPATLQIVADGSSVAVRDRRLATQDLYSINQTPLKFLLRERVNLGQDIRITSVANDGSGVRIDLEDRSTLGGTSKIMLYFDPRVETLQQWRIVDAQGFQTTVMLNKTERAVRLDQQMFTIDYTPVIGNSNNR